MGASKYADETEVRATHWMMPEMANPNLVCRTAFDKVRLLQARLRQELHVRYCAQRDRFVDTLATMDDAQLDALLSADLVVHSIVARS